jgi:hypothetical protein
MKVVMMITKIMEHGVNFLIILSSVHDRSGVPDL